MPRQSPDEVDRMEATYMDDGTLQVMAKTEITKYDWEKKFVSLVDGEIGTKINNSESTKAIILTGTHGTEFGWSGLTYKKHLQ